MTPRSAPAPSPEQTAKVAAQIKLAEKVSPFQAHSLLFKVASTPAEETSVQRLRYAVYVKEKGWEAANAQHPGLERDQLDPYCVPLGAFAPDGEAVCTMRLIFPLNGALPCLEHLETMSQVLPPLETAVEVSRVVIRPGFRYVTGAVPNPSAADFEAEAGPGNTVVQMCMCRLLIQVSAAMGLTHWFCHMEEKLAASWRKKSLVWEPVGPNVDWPNGLSRRTYMADLSSARAFWHRSQETSAQFLGNSLGVPQL